MLHLLTTAILYLLSALGLLSVVLFCIGGSLLWLIMYEPRQWKYRPFHSGGGYIPLDDGKEHPLRPLTGGSSVKRFIGL